ncbi:MAG: FMN-binding negative transcriptional regulator [Acidimicrobiales bacterium]
MYVPAHFAADDDAIAQLLANHGAADLVTVSPDGLTATMLPFTYDPLDGPNGSLLGHVAKANTHWRHTVQGEALVIVRGTDHYVSPSWYPSKAEHHKVVPTWNYVAAHVYGTVEWIDDPAWIERVVRGLTDKHEGRLDHGAAWSVDDAPADFIAAQLKAVVGVRVEVTRIEAKVKMSQNRAQADVLGVIDGLDAIGHHDGAASVRAANVDRLGS